MDITQAVACILLAMLAVFDLRSRRLPNVGVAAFAILYIAHAALVGASLASFGAHAALSAVALLTTAVLFHFRWIGGGDAKLAAAVFLWSGPAHGLAVLLIVSVTGTAVATVMLALRFAARWAALKPVAEKLRWLSPRRGVPYGVALAAGGMVAVLLQPAHAEPQRTGPSAAHAGHIASPAR